MRLKCGESLLHLGHEISPEKLHSHQIASRLVGRCNSFGSLVTLLEVTSLNGLEYT